ncbi:hypothetical protein [Photobacterium jeanii]|nr:hypothetical protein [Photobacterium jeanii]
MASDSSNVIELQTIDKQHLGFALFHPEFEANSGDCVFVIVPQNTELYDLKETTILLDIKEEGEYQWSRTEDDIVVLSKGVQILEFDGNGTLVHLPSKTVLGTWFSAKPRQ